MIAAVLPEVGAADPAMMLLPTSAEPYEAAALLGNLNAFCCDYAVRQKIGGTDLRNHYFQQFPVLSPAIHCRQYSWIDREQSFGKWLSQRVVELAYTAWDLEPFARDCGWFGPPFRWDEERRFLLRCELDAAQFHLYLPTQVTGEWRRTENETAEDLARLKASFANPRDAVAYIMDTFSIVRRKDEEKWGEYRTKRVILEIYDAMAEAMRTGNPYQTRLAPPPADRRCCHPKLKVGILAFGSLINDPGDELKPRIIFRIKTQTPFPVEYGRYSGETRGGAPTLVPHRSGAPVSAEILILDHEVTANEARNILWRRETRRIGTREEYSQGTGPTSVLVHSLNDDPCVGTILFTDFPTAGKITDPTAEQLAEHAIRSVETANEGMDGISYLINAIKCGIETPLTGAYRDEILSQTNSPTLEEALRTLKGL